MQFKLVASLLLFLSCSVFAQTAAKPQATPPATPPPSAEKPAAPVPPADAVVINGFCPGKQATGPDCKTEIPKADIDRIAEALGAPESAKRNLANAYARALVESTIAKERGLDKKPQTQEILKLTEMQTLGQLFERDVREEAAKIPQSDIDKYYAEHAGQYEQATLQRIFIPKMPPNPQEKVDEAAVKAEGSKIAAAAKQPNADFSKLQKQAYEDLKLTATPPPTELKDVRRDNIPATQAKAFDLNPGEVSEPIDDAGGVYIYKVVSKKKLTEPEVESDIKRTLEQERAQAAMQKAVGNVKLDYNDAYFGAPERPAAPRLESPHTQGPPKSSPPASKPPAGAPASTAPKTPK
jgi:hypothetical protein